MWNAKSILATTVLLAIAIAPAAGCRRGPEPCSQCGRAECTNLAVSIHLLDGRNVKTCCPMCALHFVRASHARVASMTVRDFDLATALDATAAWYVEGSDVQPCAAPRGGSKPLDERGCCLKTVYDRCLPSVLAFGTRDRAEAFARRHGGSLRTFTMLQASLH